jgi:C4-dicarboxylate transporter, DctM subunit
MLLIATVCLVVFLFLGLPVAAGMGLSSLIAIFVASREPLFSVVKYVVLSLDSYPLLAAPFFILAGEFMSKGGISRRIVLFSNALLGFVRGGLGMVDVMASMIFAGISGSATADTSAIGSIMIPQLIANGYPRGFAAALNACAGSIGMIIPPSMIMIIYGSIANESIGRLFMGGFIPGVLIGLGMMALVYVFATRWGWRGSGRFDVREIWRTFKDATWALVMPFIVLGGIMFGVFTATEAGIIATVYGLWVGLIVYKELNWKNIRESIMSAAIVTGFVMFMIASAGLISYIFTIEHVPEKLAAYLLLVSNDRNMILLIILGAILLIGTAIEMLPMLVVMVPILVPIARQFGFDPIHFGVLICIANIMGGVSPPVGGLIFITMGIAKASMSELNKYIWHFMAVMVVVLVLCVFFPGLVTFLPNLAFAK